MSVYAFLCSENLFSALLSGGGLFILGSHVFVQYTLFSSVQPSSFSVNLLLSEREHLLSSM